MNDLISTLKWLETVSVRFRPKSIATFDRVLEFTQLFENLSDSERFDLMTEISGETAEKILAISAFFAELAMSTGEAKWIKGAVMLHVIEDFRKDYRDNIRFLVLIAYSAGDLKSDFGEVVKGVLHFTSARSRNYLSEFLERDQELNELDKFGIKVSVKNDQPRFVQA